jgi:Flp pilus assembly protein TadD
VNAKKGQPSPERRRRRCVEGVLAQGQECQKRANEFRSTGQRELAGQQLERAIAHFSEAIRIDPQHAPAYVLRARAFEQKGDDDRAEADLAKAREVSSDAT